MNGRIHRELEILVLDEGVGIPAENREKIFDPFFSTKPKGTGLGLALTHKIICAHDGSIEVAPAPERGACFSVFLPVADRIAQAA
jgi:signal transduction histidine kinase